MTFCCKVYKRKWRIKQNQSQILFSFSFSSVQKSQDQKAKSDYSSISRLPNSEEGGERRRRANDIGRKWINQTKRPRYFGWAHETHWLPSWPIHHRRPWPQGCASPPTTHPPQKNKKKKKQIHTRSTRVTFKNRNLRCLTTVDTAVKRFKPPFWCVVQQQQLDSF